MIECKFPLPLKLEITTKGENFGDTKIQVEIQVMVM